MSGWWVFFFFLTASDIFLAIFPFPNTFMHSPWRVKYDLYPHLKFPYYYKSSSSLWFPIKYFHFIVNTGWDIQTMPM
jgi:hypothetical protein